MLTTTVVSTVFLVMIFMKKISVFCVYMCTFACFFSSLDLLLADQFQNYPVESQESWILSLIISTFVLTS